MKSIKIAIAAGDKDYAKALSKGLWRKNKSLRFEICEAAGRDELIIREGEKELRLPLLDDPSGKSGIYKYAPLSKIASDILINCSLKLNMKFSCPSENAAEVYSLISERGGAGVSVASIALSKELARYGGKKVLFMSLSDFVDRRYCPESALSGDLNELLYSFSENSEPEIKGFLAEDEDDVSFFRSNGGRNPLYGLSDSDFEAFVSYVREQGGFDIVVADLGSSVNERKLQLMDESRICILLDEAESLKEYLSFELGESFISRIRHFKPPRDDASIKRKDGRLEIDIDGELGADVKRFVKGEGL